MRFHKTTVKKKTYVLSSAGEFHSKKQFVDARKRKGMSTGAANKCFVCEHRFKDDEIMYIAISGAKGTKNCFVCKKCADKINNG